MVSNVTEKRLAPRQLKALESLAADGSVANAAVIAGVTQKTVYQWLRVPLFAAELRRLEGELLQAIGRRLLALGERAHAAVFEALDPQQPMAVRLRAATLVFEHGVRVAELSSIVARLEEIERRKEIGK